MKKFQAPSQHTLQSPPLRNAELLHQDVLASPVNDTKASQAVLYRIFKIYDFPHHNEQGMQHGFLIFF